MSSDAFNIDSLQAALNDAAGKASILWTTFITFEVFLVIAFGSVTHRDLFLNTPIKLPLLNVDLPLTGFFLVAPVLLAIFHFYVFLQLLAFAGKARAYETLLLREPDGMSERQYLRHRLDSFFVLQFLAGPLEYQTGWTGLWLRLIAWITLVGAPVFILLQAQVTFVAYHSSQILTPERAAVLFTLGVVWFYWTRIAGGGQPVARRISSVIWRIIGSITALLVALFCVFVATFPGEWTGGSLPSFRIIPTSWPSRWSKREDWISLHDLLFDGAIDEVSGRPRSPFSDRLIVTDQSFFDKDKFAKSGVGVSLRGRDLSRAVLSRTNLRRADFTGANLDYARIDHAELEGASFGCADGSLSDDQGEQLHPDLLPPAQTWPTDTCTWLRRAYLAESQLQGADFRRARLQGASLHGSNLEGANLSDARLQGSAIDHANLQGAILVGAHLQGAFVERSQLWGAELNSAALAISSLFESQLQGVDLDNADLRGARLEGAFLWHVTGLPLNSEFMTWGQPTKHTVSDQLSERPLTTIEYKLWYSELLNLLSYHHSTDEVRWQIALSAVNPDKPTVSNPTPKSVWDNAKAYFLNSGSDSHPPLDLIKSVACNTEAAFEILSEVQIMFSLTNDEVRKLIREMKASDRCPGFLILTSADLSKLENEGELLEKHAR